MKRTQLKRRTPLRQVGAKKLRTLVAEQEFRTAVRIAAGGQCQAHTPACPQGRHEGHHAHHRCIADRRVERHDAARGLFVCHAGHSYIHANPDESYRKGWLLKAGA